MKTSIHNFFKLFLLLALIIGFGKRASTQNYIQLFDYSGEPNTNYINALNAAADSLVAAFPTAYQDSFKVYDFGFYLHQEDYDGFSYPDEFVEVVRDLDSEYYLAFGRQTDGSGVNSKTWVDVELPEGGIFDCLTELNFNILLESLQALFSDPNEVVYVNEQIAMLRLKNNITSIGNGNCCQPLEDYSEEWLEQEGFVKLDIGVNVVGPAFTTDEPPSNRSGNERSNNLISDLASLDLEISGGPMDFNSQIEAWIEDEDLSEEINKVFILNNSNLCNGDYESSVDDMIDNLPSVSIFIYVQDNTSSEDELYMRIEGALSNANPLEFADIGGFSATGGGAANFTELVDLVRDAENALIAAGHGSLNSRLEILRGIYYGTDWSMDFEQSYGSSIRNAGFKSYLCNSSTPINPEGILGQQNFTKLKNSAEVINGGVGIDWGHVIIALESRMKWCSRQLRFPFHKSSGLEIVTWIGDIGGGAGMLAYRRTSNPGKRAIDMFGSISDFGGWLNIEGDVAAFLVGANSNDLGFGSPPTVDYGDEAFIADMLSEYLLPQPAVEGSPWYKRSEYFLKTLGGNVSGGELTNEAELIDMLTEEIEDFAENYVIVLAKGNNSDGDPSNDVNMYEVSKHLKGASDEMARIFIHTVKKGLTNPNIRLEAGGLNPNPTIAGEPYIRYKTWESTKDLIESIERWFRN